MWVRNYLGKLVLFDDTKYITNEEKYCALWKIKYNIDFKPMEKTSVGEYIQKMKDCGS